MKLYGFNHTMRNTKILIAAEYAGAQIATEDFNPHTATPEALQEFKKKNPNGKVPTLETPEGSIYESNAILRYVARYNDDSKLYGKNEFERALVDQFLDWTALTLEEAIFPVFRSTFGYGPYDKAQYEQSLEATKKALRILDDRLKQSKYLAGDSITIADIHVVADLAVCFRFLFDEKFRKPFHNLTKYYESVANEPNFVKIIGKPVLAKVAFQPYTGSL